MTRATSDRGETRPRAPGRRRLPAAEPRRARPAARLGRWLGPVLAVAVYALLPEAELGPEGRATAAVVALVATWWVTEALPLPVTGLVPIVALPLSGAMGLEATAAPYANPILGLFLGGFLLALATQRWGLHRRVALLTVRAVGTEPARLVGGFMLATAGLSMWLSNTATTVMMLPIAVSVLALVSSTDTGGEQRAAGAARLTDGGGTVGTGGSRLATALLLGTAYAASIGSLATLIGTPPNAFLAGFLRQTYGIELGFARWMAFGLPLSAVLLWLTWLALTRWLERPEVGTLPGSRAVIDAELAAQGPVSRGERRVLVVFLAAVALWLLRTPLQGLLAGTPLAAIDDPIIAIGAAIALFIVPVDARHGVFLLDWDTAKQLPWGILLLFGGGLSMAAAVTTTGVDAYIGQRLATLTGLPAWVLVAAVTVLVIGLTELTSNTATAATLIPVAAGVAVASGLDPLLLTVPVALAATCAFALPVATPPNAIVFGTGQVELSRMIRAGLVLNVIGAVLITAAMVVAGRLLGGG